MILWRTEFMLCYDATTLLTCVNSTFTVMHIFADAFTQNDMHCIHYKDFYQFMRSLGIEILDRSTFWGYSTYNQYLFTYIIIYKAPDKHGKKVTYPSLDAKPKYLVENNMHMKTDFNRQHMKTSIKNAKVSSTYKNECEMHRFHPCWRRWAQYPDASTRERTLLLMEQWKQVRHRHSEGQSWWDPP